MAKATAWLCLILLLCISTAAAVHHHADGSDSARCELCLVAASSAPTAPAPCLAQTLLAVSMVRLEPVAAAKQRLICFALTVRPPPEDRLS
jgi:hypothetical protein